MPLFHPTLLTRNLSDYADKRQGNRVVSLGEKPYLDPNSKSRREALGFVEQERVVP